MSVLRILPVIMPESKKLDSSERPPPPLSLARVCLDMNFFTSTHPLLNIPWQGHSSHEGYAKTLSGLMPAEDVRCG